MNHQEIQIYTKKSTCLSLLKNSLTIALHFLVGAVRCEMVAKWCFFLDASEVEEGDVVLMGTDGIFDNLHDSEARLKWMMVVGVLWVLYCHLGLPVFWGMGKRGPHFFGG